jgi:hypothetical protein
MKRSERPFLELIFFKEQSNFIFFPQIPYSPLRGDGIWGEPTSTPFE